MSFTLRIQDPSSSASTFLELLLESAETFDHGAGVFAFASVHGVKLLIADPIFDRFLRRGTFELIVGIDAVTVPPTLTLLHQLEMEFQNFRVRAFFHRRSGTLFHPKCCWFAGADAGRALVGSGNLTRGGLLKNWEMFGDASLKGEEISNIHASWEGWRTLNDLCLRPVTDGEVIARAALNEQDEPRRHQEDAVEQADADLTADPAEAMVLVAEIPKGGNRWNQANFDLDTFRQYFELQPGKTQRIVLIPVAADGTVGEPEVRQSVSVRSRNFRIELGQAAGLPYPKAGPPICVFLRLGTRRFRYRLLIPDTNDYAATSRLLDKRWEGRPDRMRRISIPLPAFRAILPSLAL